MISQVIYNINESFLILDSNIFDADKLLGEWDLWFFTDSENQDTNATNFNIYLNETSCHSLRGSVVRSFVRDSLVIGCVQDSMRIHHSYVKIFYRCNILVYCNGS